MGRKRNNNNRADKHQKLETIPWYLCQKLDMLGHRHGHLITVVHQIDSSVAARGNNFFLYVNTHVHRRGKVCDKIGMKTRVCSLWLLLLKP
jgi:hypothetical protein